MWCWMGLQSSSWGLPWYGTWKLAHRHGWKLAMVVWKFSWGWWPEHFSFLHSVFPHGLSFPHSIVWVPRRSMSSTPGQKQPFSHSSALEATWSFLLHSIGPKKITGPAQTQGERIVSTSWWQEWQIICSHLYFTIGVFPLGINLVAKDTVSHKMYLWHCQLFHTSTSLCHFLENQLKGQHYPLSVCKFILLLWRVIRFRSCSSVCTSCTRLLVTILTYIIKA